MLLFCSLVSVCLFLQRGPTDLHNFDPIITCIPATTSDLVTTNEHIHIEGFDYTSTGPSEGEGEGPNDGMARNGSEVVPNGTRGGGGEVTNSTTIEKTTDNT